MRRARRGEILAVVDGFFADVQKLVGAYLPTTKDTNRKVFRLGRGSVRPVLAQDDSSAVTGHMIF